MYVNVAESGGACLGPRSPRYYRKAPSRGSSHLPKRGSRIRVRMSPHNGSSSLEHLITKSTPQENIVREESAVLDDLRNLCQSPGYAHVIAIYWMRGNMVRASDGQLTPERLAKRSTELTRRKIDILVGLAVQGDCDLALPKPGVTRKYMKQTLALMEELHHVIGAPFGSLHSATPTTLGDALREPIIYGPESAYESQYLDHAVERYSADNEWLKRNCGFIIEDAARVVEALLAVRERAMEAVLRGLRTIAPGRRNLLAPFVVNVSEVAAECGFSVETVAAVLDAFALRGKNAEFATASDFNAATATPLIVMGADSYLLFQNYTLAEAVYTTPSYWMAEDWDYRDAHSDHRGRFAEKFCKKRLSAVFGRDRVFSNVKLLSGKRVVSEVDVLVLYGDRAIVVQTKSKRLTIEARKGDLGQARADFAKAIQHANDQGFTCARSLSNPDCVLALEDGDPFTLSDELKEVYVVCAVSDSYPALTFQARQFLNYERTERIQPPLVADVFLVDVVAEMLATPLRFLSYLNRRVNYHEKILTPDELGVLAVHLRENLWIDDSTDMLAILDQATYDLDAAMMVRRAGMPGEATPEGILKRLSPTVVGKVVAQVEAEPHPAAIEIGLMLLKLGEGVIRQIDAAVNGWRRQPNAKHMYGMSLSISGLDAGLTIQANRIPQAQAETYLANNCLVRKYESRATTWFGVLLDARDFATLRHAVVISYPWQPDKELARALGRYPAKKKRLR